MDVNDLEITNELFEWSEYDEKLEAEYILRVRSIFDEFVCPNTGIFLICTFNELASGLQRFWIIAQEMKRYQSEIHNRVIKLPLMFMLVLMRIIEAEYTIENHGKSHADTQLAEAILLLFNDMHKKSKYFVRGKAQKIVFNTMFIYLRHLLNILGADHHVKMIKWPRLSINHSVMTSPYRPTDIKVLKITLRHFRDEILPQYLRKNRVYKMIFRTDIPEIMEPTRQLQIRIADYLLKISAVLVASSIFLLLIVAVSMAPQARSGSIADDTSAYD